MSIEIILLLWAAQSFVAFWVLVDAWRFAADVSRGTALLFAFWALLPAALLFAAVIWVFAWSDSRPASPIWRRKQ